MDLSFKKKLFIVLIHTIEVKLVQESIVQQLILHIIKNAS